MRKGDYIGTYTGKQFWPIDPQPEEICLEDIAHALSNICRFNGHTDQFYSVATHCLNVMAYIEYMGCYDSLTMLYGLLHDASEAYICDIPRPFKMFIPSYKQIESEVTSAIYKHFNLEEPTEEIQKVIKEADNYILAIEAKYFMKNTENWNIVNAVGGLTWNGEFPNWRYEIEYKKQTNKLIAEVFK